MMSAKKRIIGLSKGEYRVIRKAKKRPRFHHLV